MKTLLRRLSPSSRNQLIHMLDQLKATLADNRMPHPTLFTHLDRAAKRLELSDRQVVRSQLRALEQAVAIRSSVARTVIHRIVSVLDAN